MINKFCNAEQRDSQQNCEWYIRENYIGDDTRELFEYGI